MSMFDQLFNANLAQLAGGPLMQNLGNLGPAMAMTQPTSNLGLSPGPNGLITDLGPIADPAAVAEAKRMEQQGLIDKRDPMTDVMGAMQFLKGSNQQQQPAMMAPGAGIARPQVQQWQQMQKPDPQTYMAMMQRPGGR